jgi:hypothetical protein
MEREKNVCCPQSSIDVLTVADQVSFAGKFYAGNLIGRVENAGWREKFMKLGATEEEVDAVISDLKKWEEDVDGWHAIMQCETICWN